MLYLKILLFFGGLLGRMNVSGVVSLYFVFFVLMFFFVSIVVILFAFSRASASLVRYVIGFGVFIVVLNVSVFFCLYF